MNSDLTECYQVLQFKNAALFSVVISIYFMARDFHGRINSCGSGMHLLL